MGIKMRSALMLEMKIVEHKTRLVGHSLIQQGEKEIEVVCLELEKIEQIETANQLFVELTFKNGQKIFALVKSIQENWSF